MNLINQKTEIPFSSRTKTSFFQMEKYQIPSLLLLEDMVSEIKNSGLLPDLSRTVFIGVQHILETTVTLFDAIIALGVPPKNMYFSGKCYSTAPAIEAAVLERGIHLMPSNRPEKPGKYEEYCQAGIAKMWEYCLKDIEGKAVDRIIVLDEGGRCLENMPGSIALAYPIAAIEQTRGGLYSEITGMLPFPLIEVATCAVKKRLEPPLIAIAVINGVKNTLRKLPLNRNMTFGVIGNGVIGNAVCRYLVSLGNNVCVFDQEETAFQGIVSHNLFRMENISEVLTMADVIIGCTGKDITAGIDIPTVVKKDKIFISCTSEDKEFRSLLNFIANQGVGCFDPLSDITCQTRNGRKILILQGGFPVNFDRTPWNVPANKIEVTQGLLLGGCLQAIQCARKLVDDGITINRGSRQALNPAIQRYIALHWLPRQEKDGYLTEYFELFDDLTWIQKNSGGQYYGVPELETCFNSMLLVADLSSRRPTQAKL